MIKSPNSSIAPQTHRASQLSWLGGTLDSYEVEELDGHSLAKLLPQIATGMEGNLMLPLEEDPSS